MDKLIILTGASGVLGSYFVEKLSSEENIEMIAITNDRNFIMNSRLEKVKAISRDDFLKDREVHQYIKKSTLRKEVLFFNLGFPRTSDTVKLADALINYEKQLEILNKMNLKLIVNISSQSVYDQSNDVKETEEGLIKPNGVYGLSKFMSERLTELYVKSTKIKFLNIRLGSLISKEFPERIINRLIRDSIQLKQLEITSGNEQMSYLYTEDAVNCLIQIVKKYSKLTDNLYNLGNDASYSSLELAKEINIVTGNNSDITVKTSDKNFSNAIDSSKLFIALDWSEITDIKDVIADLVKAFLEEEKNEDSCSG